MEICATPAFLQDAGEVESRLNWLPWSVLDPISGFHVVGQRPHSKRRIQNLASMVFDSRSRQGHGASPRSASMAIRYRKPR